MLVRSMSDGHDATAKLATSPSFRALARSLWRETELRGAALMVGAGFSRNAGLAAFDSPKPPLWGDLLRVMRDELGLDQNTAPGALKLAAQYEAMFGRGRLEGLIRRLIPDASWVPGELHLRLLRMPWTDVLTTNYDTLLERGADRITDPAYEVVLTPTDLARTRAPRIVKLHGTLPSHTPFVITESDYREYPTLFAPFVNLARQVLIENDICMLGFSGDDPNFAAWTGWVRAEIAPYSRTLFLVGILDLTGETRDAYLQRGITAIDLAPFVPDATGDRDERSAAALNLFLAALEDARRAPAEDWAPLEGWPPTSGPPDPNNPTGPWPTVHDPDFAAPYVERCAPRWRAERLAYPGWIEPPPRVRSRLERDLRQHLTALEHGRALARLDDPIGTVADVLWRVDLVHASLYPFELAWIEPMLQAADPMRLRSVDRWSLGPLLLRTHREAEDRASFERWRDWLAPTAEHDGEVRALLAYEEALWARDHLDYGALADRIAAIKGRDPVWTLRRAMLLAELGKHDAVEASLLGAFRELKGLAARDRRSLWIRSRFAWAWFLANALTRVSAPDERIPEFVAERVIEDDLLHRFDEGACNPWTCIEALDAAIADGEKQARDDAAGPKSAFDPGVVRRTGLTLRTMPIATADRYGIRLADHVGIPLTIKERVNILQSRIARAVGIFADVHHLGSVQVLVAASRGNKDLLEQRFNRIAVARLDQSVASDLFARTRHALDYALTLRQPNGYWVVRSENFVELISRLIVRLSQDDARACFQSALEFARHPNWRHPNLFKPLDRLISRSLAVMAPADRADAALGLITFPLPSEVGAHVDMDWPEPSSHIQAGTERPWDDPRWSDRIIQLIAAAEHGGQAEASKATIRLLHLSRNGMLSAEECVSFGRAFWNRRDRLGDPGLAWNIALYTVFETPAPDEDVRRSMLRRFFVGTTGEPTQPSTGSMWLLRRMAELQPAGGVRDCLSDQEILAVFDVLAAWRLPEPADAMRDLIGARTIHKGLGQEVVAALTHAVLQLLAAEQLGKARLTALRDLVDKPPLPDHLILVPQAMRLNALGVDEATAGLQEALLSQERRSVSAALWAVGEWATRHHRGDAPPLPRQLAEDVAGLVSLRVSRALPEALQTAKTLIEYGGVTPPDARRLAIGLRHLLGETAYATWAGNDEETARLTLIRADAVRLSVMLAQHGHASEATELWIAAAASDELPEVRFAAA